MNPDGCGPGAGPGPDDGEETHWFFHPHVMTPEQQRNLMAAMRDDELDESTVASDDSDILQGK